MASGNDDRLREIEANQQQLKKNIERSRELTDEAQRMIEQHRKDLLFKH